MKKPIANVTCLSASLFLMGLAAGCIAYMRGIQKADGVIIAAWFVMAPTLSFLTATGGDPSMPKRKWVQDVLLLGAPFLLLVGFLLTFQYPVWKTGCFYALLSGVLSAVAAKVGVAIPTRLRNALVPIAPRLCVLTFVLSLAATVIIIAWPWQYESINVVRFYGQGILNAKADDRQYVLEERGILIQGVLDSDEAPPNSPFIREKIGDVAVGRASWHSGLLLDLIGKAPKP